MLFKFLFNMSVIIELINENFEPDKHVLNEEIIRCRFGVFSANWDKVSGLNWQSTKVAGNFHYGIFKFVKLNGVITKESLEMMREIEKFEDCFFQVTFFKNDFSRTNWYPTI